MVKKEKGFLAKLFGKKKNSCCSVKIEEVDPKTEDRIDPTAETPSKCCEGNHHSKD